MKLLNITAAIALSAVLAGCGGDGPDSAAAPSEVAATDEFPDGTYRAEITIETLMDAGVDRSTAANHAAMWTLTFDDGEFVITDTQAEGQGFEPCPDSTYTVEDGRVTTHLGSGSPSCGTAAGKEFFSAGWELDGDELRFVDVDGPEFALLMQALFGSTPFERVG